MIPSLSAVLALTTMLSVATPSVAQTETVSTVSSNVLNVIHMNDHHSHFFESAFELVGDQIPPGLSVNTSEIRVYHGGSARIAATIQAMREEAAAAGEDIVVVHGGDGITGTLYYTLLGSDPDAAIMNAIGFDAFVPGNHEFDDGDANLADFAQKLQVPIVSHNLRPGESSPLRELLGVEGGVQPYTIKTLSWGKRVGICGITTKVSTEQSSFPDPGTTLEEEKASAEACVADLEGEGVDKIILLTHIGYDKDILELAGIEGIDIIVGGHSHSLLGGSDLMQFGFTVEDEYARIVNGTCIVTAWEYSKVVGKASIEFGDNGEVTACSGAPVMPINPVTFTVKDAEEDFDLVTRDAEITKAYLLSFPLFVDNGEDQSIVDLLAPFTLQVEEVSKETIATVPETICHSRGGEVDQLCPTKEDLSRVGGGVCPLVARSFVDNVPKADFAIQNAGGCREDILAGDFTYGDAFSILPFSNTLVTLVMTGDQIHRVLEDAFNFFLDPEIGGGSGSYPIASGLRWQVDYNKAFGERVSELEQNPDHINGEWTPLGLEETYTLVTNSFVAGARDGYYTFGEIDQNDPAAFEDSYVEYAQSLVNYAIKTGTLEEVDLEFISTQVLTFEDGTLVDIRQDGEQTDGEDESGVEGEESGVEEDESGVEEDESGVEEEEVDPNACAVVEDNDDEWCERYIGRLAANVTCDCYNFCDGEIIGCYSFGESQDDSSCSAFPRSGCTADQGTPGTDSGALGASSFYCLCLVSVLGALLFLS